MICKVKALLMLFTVFLMSITNAQEEKKSDLFIELEEKDHLLFDKGFNQFDLDLMDKLVKNDIEFYHDKDGITRSKQDFIRTIKKNLCYSGKNKIRRILDKTSLEVFPLYKEGKIYGALQTGIHSFDQTKAKFSHLWVAN